MALSLAAICAPCLWAEERGTPEFKVKPLLALSADKTRGIKRNELAIGIPGGVFRQATKNEDTPIPKGPPDQPPPPPTPLWIYVYSDGWVLADYIYRVNIDSIYGETTLDIFGAQPPYTVTLESLIPLYALDDGVYNNTGSPNGWAWIGYLPDLPPLQLNLFCHASIIKGPKSKDQSNDPNPNKPEDFKGNYRGEGKITVSDPVGNYAEAPFIVRILLF